MREIMQRRIQREVAQAVMETQRLDKEMNALERRADALVARGDASPEEKKAVLDGIAQVDRRAYQLERQIKQVQRRLALYGEARHDNPNQ